MNLQIKQDFISHFPSFNCDAYKKRTVRGKNYVAFINSTRDMEGLIETLKNELGDDAEVEQVWVDSSSKCEGIYNSPVRKTSMFEQKPIIANSCTHVLLVASDDERILDYSKFIINRYMNAYTSIMQYDDKPLRKRVRPKQEVKGEPQVVSEIRTRVVRKAPKKKSFIRKTLIRFLRSLIKLLK